MLPPEIHAYVNKKHIQYLHTETTENKQELAISIYITSNTNKLCHVYTWSQYTALKKNKLLLYPKSFWMSQTLQKMLHKKRGLQRHSVLILLDQAQNQATLIYSNRS